MCCTNSLVYLFIASTIIVPSLAYNITINIKEVNSVKVCEGDELIFTCTGRSTIQRWTLQKGTIVLTSYLFPVTTEPGTSMTVDNHYHFTLISKSSNHFESTLSTVARSALNNVVVECADESSQDTTTIRIEGIDLCHDCRTLSQILFSL